MRLRPFSAADLAGLADLETSLFGAEAWSARALGELAATPGRSLLVIDSDGDAGPGSAAVGYALIGVQGDFAELLRIGVSTQLQRQGLASTLLEAVLAGARGAGADRMLLEVSETNTAALALYLRHGFVEIDRRARYYRDGADALILQCELVALDTDAVTSGRMEP